MSEIYSVAQLQNVLNPIFRKNNVRKAILFGSYSKGNATPHSDVDLMVDSGLRGLAFFGLVDDVCESLDCDVDIMDITDIIPDSKVDREIKQTGVVIYEQEQV
ncbi:MAG: nucleotidyltransferase domain-containing protein [Clostridia bacterium]|nr:nucleotidyltransferase domain-containing protein [Clostridia bacterium]